MLKNSLDIMVSMLEMFIFPFKRILKYIHMLKNIEKYTKRYDPLVGVCTFFSSNNDEFVLLIS